MSNSQNGIGESGRLLNVHKRGPTANTGMCTQEVQLSTRDRQERQLGKTSKCAHKRSNSPHGKGNLARLPKVHTRGATLHTGKEIWQDFRICKHEVQLSTQYRGVGKTSECAHKRSNSQHEIGIRKDFQMYTQEVQLSKRDWNIARLPNIHTRGATLHTGKEIWQGFRICKHEVQLSTHIGESAKLPNVHTRGTTLNTL
ncbi:hypothetical protein PoB_002417700 [Plakobranchus ocellatus]|uniref:Uncharacterized protein n=1 Tax=Plakobranchus ocellatus TaxID=259542 RepID=A0AAV3ZSZ3_9GAST|nr:hypothetical protein PoB_002417700 [Plakobranchus ocellatus]